MVHGHVLREPDVDGVGRRNGVVAADRGRTGEKPQREPDGERGDETQHQQCCPLPTAHSAQAGGLGALGRHEAGTGATGCSTSFGS